MRLRALLAAQAALCLATGAQAACVKPWTSLFVFGDSYSDSGAGYVDGNGPTAVVYMARDLRIPFTYFGAPDMAGKGLNFAVSGARTGSEPGASQPNGAGRPPAFLGRGMMIQVGQFDDGVRQARIHFDPATTLFFLAEELNDEKANGGQTRDHIEAEIGRLYALGGRNFLIALMPDSIPQFSGTGKRLNPVLAEIPAALRLRLPAAHVALSKWGPYFDGIIKHPARYGITNLTDRCAGRALFHEPTTPCASPETHFFYHDGHPSTAVHRIVGNMLAREARAAFPDSRSPCEKGKSQ